MRGYATNARKKMTPIPLRDHSRPFDGIPHRFRGWFRTVDRAHFILLGNPVKNLLHIRRGVHSPRVRNLLGKPDHLGVTFEVLCEEWIGEQITPHRNLIANAQEKTIVCGTQQESYKCPRLSRVFGR
jgi:hypothetical protein